MTRGKKIKEEDAKKIIQKYESGKGYKEISEALEINYQTVIKIIKNYNKSGTLESKVRGGDRRSILTQEQKNEIYSWVDSDCSITLKELTNRANIKFNINMSYSTVNRTLRQFHYSLKQITVVPERRNSEYTIQKRLEYAQRFRELEVGYEDKNFVFLDEVGFCYSARTKRGRAIKGSSAYLQVPAIRTKNFSVLAAMNKYNMLFYKIFDKPLNGEDFKSGLVELKNECFIKGINNPVFLLDNARIHHYTNLIDSLGDLNINLEFLPPYSPFLNPIENCFSKWKNFIRRGNASNISELKTLIREGSNCITASDCDGFYRKMLRYINLSLNGLEISD